MEYVNQFFTWLVEIVAPDPDGPSRSSDDAPSGSPSSQELRPLAPLTSSALRSPPPRSALKKPDQGTPCFDRKLSFADKENHIEYIESLSEKRMKRKTTIYLCEKLAEWTIEWEIEQEAERKKQRRLHHPDPNIRRLFNGLQEDYMALPTKLSTEEVVLESHPNAVRNQANPAAQHPLGAEQKTEDGGERENERKSGGDNSDDSA